MNILWIEDFGAENDQKSMLQAVFKELLPTELLEKIIQNDELDLIDKPEDLTELLKNDTFHEIVLRGNYHEFNNICCNTVVLQDIDIVLLDLSLGADPESIRDDLEKNGYDRKKGGLYLYNYLIYSGFPKAHICIFTGEKDSLNEFELACKKMLIPLDKKPNAFEKNKTDYPNLRNWLKEQEQRPYLTLRRGIINACQHIKKLIKADSKKIQFQCFLRNKPKINVNGKDVIDYDLLKTSMTDYLETLEKFFSLAEPADKAKDYKLFVRTLAHEWEDNANTSNLGDKFKDELYIRACGTVMKEARNALAHNSIDGDFDEPSVAFLFIIAMRCMFQLSDKPESFERILFSLFPEEKEIATIYTEKKIELAKFYASFKKTFWDSIALDKVTKKQTELVSFKRSGDTKLKKDDFYKIFWLHLLTVKITDKNLNPNTSKDNEVFLTVVHDLDVNAFYEQFKNPNSFLFHFSRHIYPDSF